MNSIYEQIESSLPEVRCINCTGSGENKMKAISNCDHQRQNHLCPTCEGTGINVEFTEITDEKTRVKYKNLFHKVLKILEKTIDSDFAEKEELIDFFVNVLSIVPRARVREMNAEGRVLIEIGEHGILIFQGKFVYVY